MARRSRRLEEAAATTDLDDLRRVVAENFRRLGERIDSLEDAPASAPRPVQVALVTGNNLIRHGLTNARGRIVVALDAAVTIYDVPSSDPRFWILNSSGPANVSLLFF